MLSRSDKRALDSLHVASSLVGQVNPTSGKVKPSSTCAANEFDEAAD
jgi:hypothetical protein